MERPLQMAREYATSELRKEVSANGELSMRLRHLATTRLCHGGSSRR